MDYDDLETRLLRTETSERKLMKSAASAIAALRARLGRRPLIIQGDRPEAQEGE